MSVNANSTWHEANQSYLAGALAEVRAELEKRFAQGEGSNGTNAGSSGLSMPAEATAWSLSPPSALDTLCSAFDLSSFERKVLLLCAGAEMDFRFAALYATAHKDAHRTHPTFSLALAAFADAHWSALSLGRPLRRWQLIEATGGETLATSPLHIQERVLHYLAGVPCLDERLQPLVKRVAEPGPLAPSQRTTAELLAATWSQPCGGPALSVVELCGDDLAGKRAIAAGASTLVGLQLHVLAAWSLPHSALEIDTFLRLWEREAVLSSSALLLECDDPEGPEALSTNAIASLLESIRSPLIISSRSPRRCAHRALVRFNVSNLSKHEQGEVWRNALQATSPHLNGKVVTLVSQFNLSPTAIHAATRQIVKGLRSGATATEEGSEPLDDFAERLWDVCRVQARPRLEGLAQRIDPAAVWDDLVLPENQKKLLDHIAVHVRQRAKVYETWGFASKGARGLGISALFAGPSGTGKTMAAEVLANALRLDLYRIDLSQVVSKYIGETEKNLRRVFDAAEEGAAILLFDEADALFGKRSEVKDSHDRYANIEVSYLLQRMEAYRGLAILTTNRKSALDQAFLRRIRFVVEFPFPEAAQRAEIWRRVFPRLTPTENLKIDRLARLNAAGGHIRNIAMGAAFLAAEASEPVRMSHLLCAARSEFAKLEKPLPEAEIAGWV